MKKLLMLISALAFLFLATGCGEKPFNPDRTKPVGMILVNGPVQTESEAEPRQLIYAEYTDNRYVFPLDAAMVYYFDYDAETTYAGEQNCTNLTFAANLDTHTVGADAVCGYSLREGSENTVFAYYLYYDEKGLGFSPMNTLFSYGVNPYGGGIEIEQFKFTVECGRPAAFFTIACRQGEKELSFETIRPEEMEDYMKYEPPAGTDNVEINSFDTNSEFISGRTLQEGEYNCTIAYDVGGQFHGAKTMILVWPQPAEE